MKSLVSLLLVAATASAADTEPFDEIVVTSQKRSQTLQEIPAAVTVIGDESLEIRGVTTLADVQSLVPSVRLQKESASTEIYIRGVGSTLDVPMIEPPNAYNINGVYVPREVTSASLVDVERMEVLPGPQGTLYGRGAIGGVVNTITRRPGDEFETRIMVEGGNYSLVRATLTQNIPLGDNAALRGSLSYHDHDGYLASGADSADDFAGFLAFEASPGDEFRIHLWAHLESRDGYAANLVSKGSVGKPRSQAFPNKDPWDDRLEGDLESFATLGPITAQYRDWDTTLIGAEVDWSLSEALTLTYVPSHLDFDWRQEYWLTHKDGDFNESIDQQTHELRLAYADGGPVSWLAGLYAYEIETAGQLFIQFGPDELFPTSPRRGSSSAGEYRMTNVPAQGFSRISSSVPPSTRIRSHCLREWRRRRMPTRSSGIMSIGNSAWSSTPILTRCFTRRRRPAFSRVPSTCFPTRLPRSPNYSPSRRARETAFSTDGSC
jgi:iron complex outermembrane receptor protein